MTGESTEQVLEDFPSPEAADPVVEDSKDQTEATLAAGEQPYFEGEEDDPAVVVEDVTELSDAEAQVAEIDLIDPEGARPETVDLTDGTTVRVKDLRTKEMFGLLRIVTRGATPVMSDLNLDPAQGIQAFTSQLIALLVFSVPEADLEAIAFVRMMVEPIVEVPEDVVKGRAKLEQEMRKNAREALDELLVNPELDDTLGIIEAVLRREAPHLMALGKRLVAMLPSVAAIAREGAAREENQQTG